MGPAKVPRKMNKIRIKRYEDSPGSSKERKITDVALKWSHDELKQFYKAFHRYGKDWKKISAVVGRKSSDRVEALYNMHRAFLSLPKHEATARGFIALVTGHYNVLDEFTNHRGNDHKVRASVKAKKRGTATLQKVYEGPHPDDSFPEGIIPGFSPTFKKRYYGALAGNSQSHIVGRRTPRIPVIIAADRAATPENRDTISSTKDGNGVMNSNSANFPTNECSPDGRFLVMETTEATQGQTFLETNRTSDTEICQTQQHLKRRRIEETMSGCRISKVEHETMMVAEEGNKSVGLLDQKQILREFFSADDMLVLDVLQSLLNTPNEISNLKINITPGTLENDSALSCVKDEGHPPLDLSEQEEPVVECTASMALHKNQEKLSIGEEPDKETNAVHAIDITEGSSYSEPAERTRDLMGSTVNISSEMCAYAPREIEPEISMSRRSKMKSEMNRKTKYVSCNGILDNLQASKLLHCLSSELLRRWCTYEWFYSTIDFPWFTNSDLAKYVNDVNLSHVPRLTRSEWITIRSSLGKPRRFSNHFLVTEKESLEDYREKVRKCYAQLSVGLMDYLPSGLALPFSIGQQVVVLHPRSRELCDGKVVMVKPDCCKVQFDNPDLGVELVKDTDCMPANWLDNLPENIRSSFFSCNVQRNVMVTEHIPKLTTSDNQDHTSNDVSISKLPESLHTSNEQLEVDYPVESERRLEKSTFDDTGRSRGCPNNNVGHNDELEAYITSFVQSSQSQARQIVDEVMQEISGGNYRQDEEAGTWNQAACFIVPLSETAIRDAPLPSDLILNCTATVLAIKRLADARHPPANIAGVLERLSSTLRPSCSENLAIYKEIEKHISIITNQTIALVPTIVDDGCCPCL